MEVMDGMHAGEIRGRVGQMSGDAGELAQFEVIH